MDTLSTWSKEFSIMTHTAFLLIDRFLLYGRKVKTCHTDDENTSVDSDPSHFENAFQNNRKLISNQTCTMLLMTISSKDLATVVISNFLLVL